MKTKSKARRERLRRRLASKDDELMMPEVIAYGSRRSGKVIVLDTPLAALSPNGDVRRLGTLGENYASVVIPGASDTIVGAGVASAAGVNTDAGIF